MKLKPNVDFVPQIRQVPKPPDTNSILIVDNEHLTRSVYRQILSADGRNIEECSTGGEAMRRLDRGDIDVLIWDLGLPDLNGLQIMEWMKHKDIPTAVVIFSQDPTVDSAIRALRQGAFDFIHMQSSPQEVAETVGRALHRRRRERQQAFLVVRLEHSERLYRFLVEQSTDILYTLDQDGRFLFINNRVQTLLGHSRDELIGKHYSVLVHPDDLEHARFAFNERRMGDRASTNVEIRLQNKAQGTRRFENRSIVTILSAQGLYGARNGPNDPYFLGTFGVARDISARKKAEETIAFHAFHDLLTGLPNRVLFQDRLSVALTHAKRKGKRLAVMYLDIDHFKQVNDTLGHHGGDELLKSFAKRARACLRSGDTLARQGGDEFTVLLPDVNSVPDTLGIAAKMMAELDRPFKIAGHALRATASIGVASYPEDGETPEMLIHCADMAMYKAKDQGKNAVFQYSSTTRNDRTQATLESDLRTALESGDQFELHYQPRISARDGTTIGAEALVRWHHPQLGLLPPDAFVPLAESVGLIVPLSDWVIETALSQLASWRRQEFQGLRLALNVSPQEFTRSDLPTRLMGYVNRHAVPAQALDLEISEKLLMNDAEQNLDTVKQLRTCGVSVSIDDFGTCYSSLNLLRRFPINSIKIDHSFVRDLNPSNRGSVSIIEAISAIARSFGLRILAEGVETAAQRKRLRRLGCGELQGYLFSRPLPANDFADFLIGGSFPLSPPGV